MTRRSLLILFVTLLTGAAAWWMLRVAPAPEGDKAAYSRPDSSTTDIELAAVVPPLAAKKPAVTPVSTTGQGAAADDLLPPPWPDSGFLPEEFEQDRIHIFRKFQAVSEDWTVETFASKVGNLNELNGRQAYEVYAYLRACHRQPRNVSQMQRRTDRVLDRQRSRQSLTAEEIDQYVAGLEKRLLRCEALPPDDELIPMMIGWLTLAAERGFPQAQLAYHKSIRWLLSLDPWGPYRYPQQVHDYRRLAPLFLESALGSGHPDAFYEYSLALREAILFDEDPQAAFAYAHAATLAATEHHDEAEAALQALEPVLTPDQQRTAREAARELCQRWCRG